MISAVVFSRDRAAQLDLCLRSIALNAPWVSRTTVIYKATTPEHAEGYAKAKRYNKTTLFVEELEFQTQVRDALKHGDYAMFVCDDDVLYRPLNHDEPTPDQVLTYDPLVLCVSLRLGLNTHACYSLRRRSQQPALVAAGGYLHWRWHNADGDWAYPGSLDGHIFRTDQLLTLLTASWTHEAVEWSGPNELEDHLHRATRTALLPHMACYRTQSLVGVPVNSTQDAYKPNRNGERFHGHGRYHVNGLHGHG